MTTKTRKPMTFEAIPSWAIDASERNRYTVAAAFALAGLTGKWVRLTAATQRALFGAVMFGKCQVFVSNEGVKASRTVCFGTDCSGITLDWDGVEKYMATGRRPCF